MNYVKQLSLALLLLASPVMVKAADATAAKDDKATAQNDADKAKTADSSSEAKKEDASDDAKPATQESSSCSNFFGNFYGKKSDRKYQAAGIATLVAASVAAYKLSATVKENVDKAAGRVKQLLVDAKNGHRQSQMILGGITATVLAGVGYAKRDTITGWFSSKKEDKSKKDADNTTTTETPAAPATTETPVAPATTETPAAPATAETPAAPAAE